MKPLTFFIISGYLFIAFFQVLIYEIKPPVPHGSYRPVIALLIAAIVIAPLSAGWGSEKGPPFTTAMISALFAVAGGLSLAGLLPFTGNVATLAAFVCAVIAVVFPLGFQCMEACRYGLHVMRRYTICTLGGGLCIGMAGYVYISTWGGILVMVAAVPWIVFGRSCWERQLA